MLPKKYIAACLLGAMLAALSWLWPKPGEAAGAESPWAIIASSNQMGDKWSLSLVQNKNSGRYLFMVAKMTSSDVAFVEYSRELYNFYVDKPEADNVLQFDMAMLNAPRDTPDDELGVWDGAMHIIPVYVLYNVKNGEIIYELPFYSATELKPGHYHDEVKYDYHNQLVAVFIETMPRLHEAMEKNNIDLP